MCSPRKPGALRGMARPDQRATGALGLLRAPLRAHACSQEALRTYGVNLVASSWWGDKSWEINSPLLPPSLIRYPDIVLRTKEIKVLLGSPSLLVISLMP